MLEPTSLKEKYINYYADSAIQNFSDMFGFQFEVGDISPISKKIDFQHEMIFSIESVGNAIFSFYMVYDPNVAIRLVKSRNDGIALTREQQITQKSIICEIGNIVAGGAQVSLEKEYGELTLGLPVFWNLKSPNDFYLSDINHYSVDLISDVGNVQLILAWDFRELGVVSANKKIRALNKKLQSQTRELSRIATKDELTGLLNVRQYNEDVEFYIQKARDSAFTFSLILFDLDNFKQLNDDLGHQYGDEVLKEVAITLDAVTRSDDQSYRYGGDEFLIILPGANEKNAINTAKRIFDHYDEHKKSDNSATFSLGIVTFKEGFTQQELFDHADKAMYEAKKVNGHAYCISK